MFVQYPVALAKASPIPRFDPPAIPLGKADPFLVYPVYGKETIKVLGKASDFVSEILVLIIAVALIVSIFVALIRTEAVHPLAILVPKKLPPLNAFAWILPTHGSVLFL